MEYLFRYPRVAGEFEESGGVYMKRRFSAFLCSLVLMVLVISPAWAGTIAALPAWPDDAIYFMGGVEETKGIISSVVDSAPFKLAAAMAPDLGMVKEWLDQFPVKSASWVFGMTESGFSLHCAIQMDGSKKEMLEKLAAGKGEKRDIDALLNSPLPLGLDLLPLEGSTYAVAADDIAFALISVEGDMILAGMSPEDIEAARGALADPAKRMKLERRLPQKNFLYFHDNGMAASELTAQSMGVLGEPTEDLLLELGFGTVKNGFGLSVFTNFARVFGLDDLAQQLLPIKKDDMFLAGGGHAWLAWAARAVIEKKHFQIIRDVAEEGDYDAKQIVEALEQLKTMGITEDAIIKMIRSAGIVLGGEAKFHDIPVPGGYFYISGEKDSTELLLPLLEAIVKDSGEDYEPLVREGWQALYVLRDPAELILGIRDGVFIVGLLSVDYLGEEPKFAPAMEEMLKEGKTMLFQLDMGVVRRLLAKLMDPDAPIAAVFLAGDDDFLESAPVLFEALKATAGFKGLQISFSDLDRFDLTALIGAPDAAEVKAIDGLASKWQEYIAQMDEEEEVEAEEELEGEAEEGQ